MGARQNDPTKDSLDFLQIADRLFGTDQLPTYQKEVKHSDPPVLAPKNWRSDALSLIHRLSQEVIDATLVPPILKDIASVITSSFPISFAAIETYKEGKLDFSVLSKSFEDKTTPQLSSIPRINETLAGEVMRRGTTLILSDAHKNNYYLCPSLPEPQSVYHYIGVPLCIDGSVSGVLSIATSHHIIVDKETLTWAETIAHHISALLTREAVASKLKDHENLAANMLNALSSPTMMCTKDGTIVHVNSAFRSIVEVFHSRTIDENSTNFFRLFDNAHQSNSYVHELRERLKDLFNGGTKNLRLDLLLTRAGFHRWYLATMSLMPDGESAIVMFVDISDRKHAEEQLEHEMLHDQSTGLANRILFHDRINSALNSNAENETATCVFALEVGRYGFIVESLGHDAADRVILKVSKRLESMITPTDLIARVGSSEFALYIEHIHSADQARDFALNVIDLFRSPFEIDGQEILLIPSIGIALSNPNARIDADMFLHDAHAAMTQARDNSATSYAFASVSRSTEAYKKLKRERELKKAIEENQLTVFYQPEVELLTGRIIGVEALVRWQHPKHGLLLPESFIDLSEESGLIDPLFDWVFDRVIFDAQELFSNGYDFCIWSNLSAKQFSSDFAAKNLSRKISLAQVPSQMFGIEITETAVMENSKTASETLSQLKNAGFSLALDDFGTGYSSLAYLQSFPVDIIKIDRTFISELGKSNASTEIVSAVIGLAHGLKLKVLAEGVESVQSESLLRELGCDLAQGFHYSRPLAINALLDFLGRPTL